MVSSVRLLLLAFACAAAPSFAQDRLDQTDPARQARELPRLTKPQPSPPAAPQAPAAEVESDSVFAGAIAISGARVIPRETLAPAFAGFVGRRLDRAELGALAAAVAGRARAAGFPLASAVIPAQRLEGGVLTVALDEGVVDAVEVAGADSPAVARLLAPLADGQPVRQDALDRALLLAAEVPGVTVEGARLVRTGERRVLQVDVRVERVRAQVAFDNRATEELGPVRARLRVELNQMLASDDRLTLEGVATPLNPRELALAAASWQKGLGRSGATGELSGYYARTHPGGVLRDRDIEGESWRAAAGFSVPVVRTRRGGLSLGAEGSYRRSRQEQRRALARDDRVTALAARADGYLALAGGTLGGRAVITQGVDLFDSTGPGDPLASRRDADGRFTKLEAAFGWTGALADNVELRIAGEGQLASGPLLASEEFAIGGARFGRGFDPGEKLGDQGVAGMIELRWDLGPELYAFADGGLVDDLGRDDRVETLASAGAGIRFKLVRDLSVELEIAQPLEGRRFDGGKSPRLSFELRARF